MSFSVPRVLALALLPLLAAACTSPGERRAAIEQTSLAWHETIPDDSLEDMLDDVRALGALDAGDPQALLSVPVLTRLVAESPSALVRAEALGASWRLARDFPTEPPVLDDGSIDELVAAMDRLLAAEDDPGLTIPDDEALALAERIGRHRFGPGQIGLAITLGEVCATRGLSDDGPVGRRCLELAPSSLRHALALVTERASDDRELVVRQAAYAAVPALHPQLGLSILAGALLREEDDVALLELLDVFRQVGPRMALDDRLYLLDQLVPSERAATAVLSSLAVRRRVDALRAEWTS